MNSNNKNSLEKVDKDSIIRDYHLYFAYGSNMDNQRLFSRIGSADKFDNGIVYGKKLWFNKLGQDGTGKANLVDDEGGIACGVLFHVNESDMIKLDKFEVGYEREILRIKSDKNGDIMATSYLADCPIDFINPSKEYMEHIVQGADNNDMKHTYIEYLKTIPTIK
jgi:gamma-glutamylcyclotransferase